MPQLLTVPRVELPVGENFVTMVGWLRPGPESSMRVSAVTRRLKLDAVLTAQLPLAEKAPPACFQTSTTDTPCIATSRSTSFCGRTPSAVLVGPVACRNCGTMYSWFMARTPRLLPTPGVVGTLPLSLRPKYSTPSWQSPERRS